MTQPFSFDFPEEVTTFISVQPRYIKASDGVMLAYYSFLPKKIDHVMIFYHGGGAYSMNLYQYMAYQLMKNHSIATYLFDIRGHGNSRGERGDAPSTEQVWQDITTAIDFVKGQNPQATLFLGGHSSGAGLVLNYNLWHQHPAIKGYVLLAPYLGARAGNEYEHDDVTKRFVRKVRLFPLMLNSLTRGYFFAHTPVVYFNYTETEKRKDPHFLDYYTNAMTHATSPYDPNACFKKINKPFLMCIGSNDEQFIPEKTMAYAQHATQLKTSHIEIMSQVHHLNIVYKSLDLICNLIKRS